MYQENFLHLSIKKLYFELKKPNCIKNYGLEFFYTSRKVFCNENKKNREWVIEILLQSLISNFKTACRYSYH